MRRVGPTLVLTLAPLLAACAAAPAPRAEALDVGLPAEGPPVWEVLRPNDLVRVVVWRHPEASTLSAGERVSESGVLALPLLGGVEVAGLTVEEARLRIRDRLADFIRDPEVSVTVLERGPRDFFVLGHVNRPGAYPVDRRLSAIQALAFGGGFSAGADQGRAWLLRQVEDRLAAHEFDPGSPDARSLVTVRPGDVIFVRRSGAGRFADEVLPYLQGVGYTMSIPLAVEGLFDD